MTIVFHTGCLWSGWRVSVTSYQTWSRRKSHLLYATSTITRVTLDPKILIGGLSRYYNWQFSLRLWKLVSKWKDNQSNVGTNGLKNERLNGYYHEGWSRDEKSSCVLSLHFLFAVVFCVHRVDYFWLLPHFSLDHQSTNFTNLWRRIQES